MADEKEKEWDEQTWSRKYIKFTHGCMIMDSVDTDLRKHAKVNSLLDFYGLYKQIMCGDNTASQPSLIYPEGRLKWNAWTKCKGLSRQQAFIKWERLYTRFITLYPSVFSKYQQADLREYDPLKWIVGDDEDAKIREAEMSEMKAEIKTLQMQIHLNEQQHGVQHENGKNGKENGVKYIQLKQEQYRQIIEYVNQLKNKMKKYHSEFEKNREHITSLKESKEEIERKMNDIEEANKKKVA